VRKFRPNRFCFTLLYSADQINGDHKDVDDKDDDDEYDDDNDEGEFKHE